MNWLFKCLKKKTPLVFFSITALLKVSAATNFSDTDWVPLSGLAGINGIVYAVVVNTNTGELFAGGTFNAAGGAAVNNIAKWDGTNWSPLGTGINGTVYAMVLDATGKLDVAGGFTTAGGGSANCIAQWNGNSWSALGSGTGVNQWPIYALTLDNMGNLYAGGHFPTIGGMNANNIAKWNGSNWSALGSGIGPSGYSVFALTTDSSGNVYAGGQFYTAGGIAATNLATWNGSAWLPITGNLGVNGMVKSLLVAPNGTLFVGGQFSQATGRRSQPTHWSTPRIFSATRSG